MRLASWTERSSLGEVPLIGNLKTGGVIGLTPEGAHLCDAMSEKDVDPGDVLPSCEELVEHLRRGGYLEGCPPAKQGVRSAYLHVTQRCNLRCRFCYSEGDDRNVTPDPSLAELCAAIDLLSELGARRLVISGGEPFLREDLPQVARHATDRGIEKIDVLTNGLLVTRERVEPLTGVVSQIAVAFDGCGPHDPAHLRGEQNYERLVSAIALIRDAGIQAHVLPTLHGRNVGDMNTYAGLARQLGASLSFSLLTACPGELGDLALSDGQLAELGRDAAERGFGCDDLVGGGLAARRSCGAGVRTLSVAADGTVYPCHMLHARELAMGNAFRDPADAVMSCEVARIFAGIDARELDSCASCPFDHLCAGGCRARAYMATGQLTGRDPYCELPRSYYARLGELLGQRYGKGGD